MKMAEGMTNPERLFLLAKPESNLASFHQIAYN